MIDEVKYNSPLAHGDHSVLEWDFKCYYELNQNCAPKWNFFKGNYEEMEKELNINWEELLVGDDPDELVQKDVDKI